MCHAALVLTHPGYGLYATGSLALYTGLRCLEQRNRDVFYRGAIIAAVGLVLSSPHTLPMMAELADTLLSGGWSLAV